MLVEYVFLFVTGLVGTKAHIDERELLLVMAGVLGQASFVPLLVGDLGDGTMRALVVATGFCYFVLGVLVTLFTEHLRPYTHLSPTRSKSVFEEE